MKNSEYKETAVKSGVPSNHTPAAAKKAFVTQCLSTQMSQSCLLQKPYPLPGMTRELVHWVSSLKMLWTPALSYPKSFFSQLVAIIQLPFSACCYCLAQFVVTWHKFLLIAFVSAESSLRLVMMTKYFFLYVKVYVSDSRELISSEQNGVAPIHSNTYLICAGKNKMKKKKAKPQTIQIRWMCMSKITRTEVLQPTPLDFGWSWPINSQVFGREGTDRWRNGQAN